MSANQTAVGAAGAVSAAVGAGSAAVGGSTAAVTSTSTAATADSSAAGCSGSGSSSSSSALTVLFLLVLATQPPWASGVLRDDGGYSFEVLEVTIHMDILALLGGAPEYCCCF